MATMPDAFALGERPVPQPGGGAASYEPPNWRQVGMAGQVGEAAGADLQEASQIVAATNERQDEQVAKAAVNTLQQQRVGLEFDQKAGFRNLKEGQVVGPTFQKDWLAKFNEAQNEVASSLTSPNQKRIFLERAAIEQGQYRAALLQHQATETDKFNDTTDNNTVQLALRGIAARPQDELGFQIGLGKINDTIDALGARKGLPSAAIAELKAKTLDSAYTTRILSTMNGIPGVVQADPYGAEKMFKQVQGSLGPASQVTLAHEVQKSVQAVQQRDNASSFIFGGARAIAPSVLAPAATGAPLEAVVRSIESGGNMNAVSSKGAVSDMQVMGATSADPGFGVRPAQPGADGKVSLQEMARVGRDYLGAMSARYTDPVLTLAAYNAGPGQVDKWIQKFGDPRTGAISSADWAAKIPFDETRAYVQRGTQKLAAAGALQPPQDGGAPPTANQLKTDLYQRVQSARDLAQQQYPGDTAYADGVAARVESYGRMVIANQQAQEAGARDALYAGMIGTKPDGSDAPRTIDQLLTDPQMKATWDKATPEARMAIQEHFKRGGGDPPRSPSTQATLYRYMGMAANDREGFAKEDLSPLIPLLPHADFDRLSSLQLAARNKQELAADKAVNLEHALSLSLDYALKPMGISRPTDKTPAAKRAQFDQFTGALTVALDNFKQVQGKPPTDQDIVKIAKGLTATVQVPGSYYGHNPAPAFAMTPEQEAQAVPPMTPAEMNERAQLLQNRYGFHPTDSMVHASRVLELLHPYDMNRLRQFDQTMKARK